ncbi:MAG: response regulator transcription factor [Bacteroidetes bacterium]|nr:response regulator transcription factor [Bacteroidota bacterium]
MKVVIIEDEAFAALRLKNMINEFNPEIRVVAELESVSDSVKWFRNNPEPDLIFLDIHLEDDLSFAIFEQVDISCPIIFTTAFDEYAIRAFKLKSIDYLLKPIVHEELAAALKKYEVFSSNNRPVINLQSIKNLLSADEKKYRDRFSVTIGSKIKVIEVSDIAYCFAHENAVYTRLTDGSTFTLDYTLDKLESLLNPDKFFRINRKFIIALKSIQSMHAYSRGRIKLILAPKPEDDFDTIVSTDRAASFREWLNM